MGEKEVRERERGGESSSRARAVYPSDRASERVSMEHSSVVQCSSLCPFPKSGSAASALHYVSHDSTTQMERIPVASGRPRIFTISGMAMGITPLPPVAGVGA